MFAVKRYKYEFSPHNSRLYHVHFRILLVLDLPTLTLIDEALAVIIIVDFIPENIGKTAEQTCDRNSARRLALLAVILLSVMRIGMTAPAAFTTAFILTFFLFFLLRAYREAPAVLTVNSHSFTDYLVLNALEFLILR